MNFGSRAGRVGVYDIGLGAVGAEWNLHGRIGGMDRWDLLIVLFAGYVAVMSLVRLMARRRNELVDHVRQQINEQRPKKKPAADDAGQDAA